tara:strand:+ start:157 stop:345 length:189 start_codon:yes stop_codon:yes gene_type:complete
MHKEKQDLREKMEDRRKQLNLKWEGWEEDERERQGGGILIVIAFIAVIVAIAGTVIYIIARV